MLLCSMRIKRIENPKKALRERSGLREREAGKILRRTGGKLFLIEPGSGKTDASPQRKRKKLPRKADSKLNSVPAVR